MNPSSKNWLKEYDLYYTHLKTTSDYKIISEDDIYEVLFRSSLLFLVPLEPSSVLHPDFGNWNIKEKIKIIFTHYLFQLTDLYLSKSTNSSDFSEVYNRLIEVEQTSLSTEAYIDHLIDGKKDSWLLNAYNINPWIFLVLIRFYFLLKGEILDNRQIQMDILKGMFAASNVDNIISNNEKRLLKRYIENGNFSEKDKLFLYQYPNFDASNNKESKVQTVINKISYDLALFALMSNKKISDREHFFIDECAQKLSISVDQQHRTFSWIQKIYLHHYQELPHLRNTYSFSSIKNVANHNLTFLLKKNSKMIVNEIKESKELIVLLRKSTDKELSTEEKAKIREQILDLLKTIPSLTIFMIPGGTIILPILMKILPEDLLYPSSFINKNAKD